MKQSILTWQQTYKAGISHCGGKGWNLARLDQFGFNVPAGGTLTGDVFCQLMSAPSLSLLIQDIQNIPDDKLAEPKTAQLLQEICQKILSMGLAEEIRVQLALFLEQYGLHDVPLAIRSSATLEDGEATSFAGIHDSFLNVMGMKNIERAILKCFTSLWTLRAVSYRRKMNIKEQELGCAVVIMALVDAKSSGIAFSCDPVTGREDVCVINANFGLGESVVSGVAEPDEYHLIKQHMNLISCKIGHKSKQTLIDKKGGTCLVDSTQHNNKQVLSEDDIFLLGRMLLRVYWALGQGEQHQDIEWAFDGQQFYLLQARPVTVLPRLTCDGLKKQVDIWSNGNFRDAAPLVQDTLEASIFSDQIDIILRATFENIAYVIPHGLRFAKFFQGRVYCNSSLMQWLYYDCFGHLPSATNRSMGGQQPEIEINNNNRGGVTKKISRIWNILKLMREMNRHNKLAIARATNDTRFANQYRNMDLTSLCDNELIDHLKQCEKQIEAYALPFIMLTSRSGSILMLFDILEKYLPDTGVGVATALLAGAGNITSANHGYRLQELALLVKDDPQAQLFFNKKPFQASKWKTLPESSVFKQEFQKYIDEYGHRAVYEIYLSHPRWREDQSYLLQVIQQSIGSQLTSKLKIQRQKKAKEAWDIIRKNTPFYVRPIIKILIKQAADGAASKEMAKSNYIRLLEPMRLLLLEVGRRFELSDLIKHSSDIFHCAFIELISLLNGEWKGQGLEVLIQNRKIQKAAWEQLTPPDVIFGDEPHYSSPLKKTPGDELAGMGVAAGCAEGIAHIVHSPNECAMLKLGEVLVAPSTDPAWTPLFLNASAIVMETGGQLSHGAIVAREYGIPAVVNISGLFHKLSDGDRIVVDGDRGVVKKCGGILNCRNDRV